jgi:uncharacterized protein with HEPN domain
MSLSPPDHVLLSDMLEWTRKVQRFVADVSSDAFLNDERTQSAAIHGLIVIGEIASRISEQTRESAVEIPWHEIRGMRNRPVHDYFGVDIDEVWRTATVDLPALEAQVVAVLARH